MDELEIAELDPEAIDSQGAIGQPGRATVIYPPCCGSRSSMIHGQTPGSLSKTDTSHQCMKQRLPGERTPPVSKQCKPHVKDLVNKCSVLTGGSEGATASACAVA